MENISLGRRIQFLGKLMLKFYLKEALNTFKHTKVLSFFSIASLSLSICFIACAGILFIASSKIEEKLKNKIEVIVFIDDNISFHNKDSIVATISRIDVVEGYSLITKEQALLQFERQSGQDFSEMLESNPLPAYYSLRFNKYVEESDILGIKKILENLSGVSDVVIDHDIVISILSSLSAAKFYIVILSIILTMISVYLIFSSSKFYILHNSQKYNTMKLVGAKLSSIKIPLLLRGAIIGALSSIVSIIIANVTLVTIHSFTHQIKFVTDFYFINFVLFLMGLLLGPIGTGIFNKQVSLKITSN